jgi:response regulator NasT
MAEVRRKVVLAEDEALIRMDLKEMLEEEGYEVVAEAGDGESAVRLASEHRPDLVVLDIKMPGLDGLSAAERISEQGLGPVLILTAFSQKDLVERAAQARAMGYLVKPFQKADLIPAIELAVARHGEMQALESEVADLSERLETRKLVDRAKGVLMDKFGMREADAFRFLQKTAMDRRLAMGEVARRVVEGELEAGGT